MISDWDESKAWNVQQSPYFLKLLKSTKDERTKLKKKASYHYNEIGTLPRPNSGGEDIPPQEVLTAQLIAMNREMNNIQDDTNAEFIKPMDGKANIEPTKGKEDELDFHPK